MQDLKNTKKRKKSYYKLLDIFIDKVKHNPLMIAYILFLFLCVIVHLLSNIFIFEFPMWQRIVVAATIASYAFTLSSSPKMMSNIDTKHIKYIEIEILLLKQTLSTDTNSTPCCELIQEEIKNKQEELQKIKQTIAKEERYAFIWEFVGFLAFFCILSFEKIYSTFAKSQELFTLIAFALVLFVNFIESLLTEIYEDSYITTKETYTTILENLEKVNNGKT